MKGKPLYRSRRGVLFGVCRGIAEYLDLSVFWVRVVMALVFIFSGFFPIVLIYLAAAIIMKAEPRHSLEGHEDYDFYETCSGSPTLALERLKRHLGRLERRTARMESKVTSRTSDWDRRFHSAP